jgi:hypothetical protein
LAAPLRVLAAEDSERVTGMNAYASYDVAKYIMADKMADAEHRRLVAEFQAARPDGQGIVSRIWSRISAVPAIAGRDARPAARPARAAAAGADFGTLWPDRRHHPWTDRRRTVSATAVERRSGEVRRLMGDRRALSAA